MTRRAVLALGVLLIAAVLGGCSTDQYARKLIEQDTSYGKINEAMMGSSEQLRKRGKIFAGARHAMPDGTEIDAWVLKASGGQDDSLRGTVGVLHGLCDSKVTYMRIARDLNRKGFDVVLIDLRAHGRSSGKQVTYGALEKHDVKRVLDRLVTEKTIAEPLYLMGKSIGAATAIQCAAIEPRIRGVVALAPYRDMRSVCWRFFKTRIAPFMSQEDFEKVLARAGQIGKFDPAEASTLDAIRKVRCPVLLMHGRLDTIVPHEDSQALYAAATGPKALEVVPYLGHVGLLFGREAKVVEAVEQVASGTLPISTTQPAEDEAPATQPAEGD